MAHSPFIRLSQVGGGQSSILINDIDVGEGGRRHGGRGGFPRPGNVYVPTTGSIDLVFSSSVALSYESGAIRTFIDNGVLLAEFHTGSGFAEGIRSTLGFEDVNDLTTQTTPITLAADTWTPLPNDGAGPQSTGTTYLPDNVSQLWDVTSGKLDFTDLTVGDTLLVRVDFVITPVVNNAQLQLRLNFPAFGGFQLTKGLARLDDGAGITYNRIESIDFYIGSEQVKTDGAFIELNCSSVSDVNVNGFFIKLI